MVSRFTEDEVGTGVRTGHQDRMVRQLVVAEDQKAQVDRAVLPAKQ